MALCSYACSPAVLSSLLLSGLSELSGAFGDVGAVRGRRSCRGCPELSRLLGLSRAVMGEYERTRASMGRVERVERVGRFERAERGSGLSEQAPLRLCCFLGGLCLAQGPNARHALAGAAVLCLHACVHEWSKGVRACRTFLMMPLLSLPPSVPLLTVPSMPSSLTSLSLPSS